MGHVSGPAQAMYMRAKAHVISTRVSCSIFQQTRCTELNHSIKQLSPHHLASKPAITIAEQPRHHG